MIQDIAPHIYHNEYTTLPPDQDSIVLYYNEHRCLLKVAKEGIAFPTFKDMGSPGKDIYENATYLFSIDEERYYLVPQIKVGLNSGYAFENIRIFRNAFPKHRSFAGITGYQLYNWYKSHRYCGRCGNMMCKDDKERMLYCKSCHNTEYPKICPAVIIAVTNKDRILLSKYAGRTFKKYALLAGYVEIGETVEQTVRREVMEEVGLKIRNLRYYKSQPWSFSETILMGFYCELDGDDTVTLETEELALAQWFDREEIPVEPSDDSLTNEMIIRFKNNEI